MSIFLKIIIKFKSLQIETSFSFIEKYLKNTISKSPRWFLYDSSFYIFCRKRNKFITYLS